jgi:hypothetical protein
MDPNLTIRRSPTKCCAGPWRKPLASGLGAFRPEIPAAYAGLIAAIDAGEVGRSFLRAVRVHDLLHWPYQQDDAIGLVENMMRSQALMS